MKTNILVTGARAQYLRPPGLDLLFNFRFIVIVFDVKCRWDLLLVIYIKNHVYIENFLNFSLNKYIHLAYLYGLSPLCVLICVVTLLDWENVRLQIPQWNGFSPEWVLQCAVRLAACEKDLLQSKHLYGRSPEWVRMWVFSVLGRAYLEGLSTCQVHEG